MLVTLIADASHCPRTKAGGYAFWIACQRGKLGSDGALKGEVVNNTVAEVMAVLNALHFGVKRGLIKTGDKILVQSDCLAALQLLCGRRNKKTDKEVELEVWFNKFCESKNIRVMTRHVKGHTKHADARFVVNNICDRKARRAMRKARNALRIKGLKEVLDND